MFNNHVLMLIVSNGCFLADDD